MLTIKELADSLDLPKSKINYQVSKLDSNHIVVLNGIKHLTKDGQRLIKKSLGLKEAVEDNLNLNSNLDGFEQLFKHFESQLNAKNQQIDKLHTLLDQQQQLTLQGNKQIEKLQLKLEHTSEEDSSDINISRFRGSFEEQERRIKQIEQENKQLKDKLIELEQTPKKGFWQRLFNS